MRGGGGSGVDLVAVDDAILDELVAAAVSDAAADEVTPPITAENRWSPIRVGWLRGFHVACRAGLDGPAGEATWAVRSDGRIVGSVRLKRTEVPGVLETGIWLTRRARGHGVGRQAMREVLARAAADGAHAVRATTAAGNRAALAVLADLGFVLTENADSSVDAVLPVS